MFGMFGISGYTALAVCVSDTMVSARLNEFILTIFRAGARVRTFNHHPTILFKLFVMKIYGNMYARTVNFNDYICLVK